MTPNQIVAAIELVGGQVEVVAGARLRIRLPQAHGQLLDYARLKKGAILDFLSQRVLTPVACACSARPYPHIHSMRERQDAARAWNGDSRQIVEPIQ
jgi:hypothetical protein